MSDIILELIIDAPVYLELLEAPKIYIEPSEVPPDEPLFKASEAFHFEAGDKDKLDSIAPTVVGWGAKSSAVDEGYLGQKSLTDDYEYTCVLAGAAGAAKWKKTVMFYSE